MHHLLRLAIAAVLTCLAGAALADPPHPNLYKGERLVPIEVLPGKPVQIKGWTRDGKGTVYSLHVRAGEKIGVNFWTPSRFTYLVLFDVSKSDEDAFYSSDEDGNVKTLVVTKNTTWLVRPYYSRVAPRRGLGAPYTVTLDIRP